MIKNKQKCMILKMCSVILFAVIVSLFVHSNTAIVYASTDEDKMIVVSLGDSYSSGEGIEPFYGQYDASDQPVQLLVKVEDENWLAHRSTLSWPSLIEFPGIDGIMGDYITAISTDTSAFPDTYSFDFYSDSNCEWYFAAVSGAVTDNINTVQQVKEYNTKETLMGMTISGEYSMPLQIDVFDQIDESVDYVTITIGGNDIGFADLITACVLESTYVELELSNYGGRVSSLEHMIEEIWFNFGETKNNITQVYMDISEAAGSQANIIVVGYPKLFDENIDDNLISAEEAKLINNLVVDFNDEIESIVDDLRETMGMNIYFVDVEQEFEGYEAYSDDPWINEIIFGAQAEDLDSLAITSAYSMHPNADGAEAYARCVNEMIEEIETEKNEVEDAMLTNETIYGLWIVDASKSYEESGMSLQNVFGTSVRLSPGSMEIGEDGSFKFTIGYDGGEGTYTWSNNIVSYEIELYNSGEPTGTVTLEDSVEGQTYMILHYDIGTEIPYKLYFTKEEQLDITAISTEQLVGEWYIDDYTTYYSTGYTLKEIYGNNIEYNEKALRMYQDKTYEYDVDSYGNIEFGTYIVEGDRVIFNCENTNGDVELSEMAMVEDWNQLKLIKLHNGSEVRYFQTSNELAETTIQETPVGVYAFDTIDDVIDHVLKVCNAWDENDGLYVVLDNGSDIMTNEDGSVSFVVRYQKSEEELQALADSGIENYGTGYTYCMDVVAEMVNGKYYLKYDDGSYYEGE